MKAALQSDRVLMAYLCMITVKLGNAHSHAGLPCIMLPAAWVFSGAYIAVRVLFWLKVPLSCAVFQSFLRLLL